MKHLSVLIFVLLFASTSYGQITKDSLIGKWKSLKDKGEVIKLNKKNCIIYYKNKRYGSHNYHLYDGTEISFQSLKIAGQYVMSLSNDTLTLSRRIDGEPVERYERIKKR